MTSLLRSIAQPLAMHAQLGHSNLIYCFMSRIARKSESVGRNKFVNVMYEYHYKVMNIIIRNSEPNVSSTVAGKTVGETSTTLPRFTSALTHSWSVMSISHKNSPSTWKLCPRSYHEEQLYGSRCACALLNHTHKFTFMNQIGKILSRGTRETIHQIGVA